MDFCNLFANQPKVVELINNSFKNNRLSQTYMFYGEKGTLKMDAALYLASLILCENNNACGKCSECKKIERLSNPNIFIISAETDTIKKEQIDQLEHEFSLKSDSSRVFIIRDIDKATLSASNSLLKFLESMNESTYGILLTENINQVIATVKSRSILVHFVPKNKMIIKKYLEERGATSDDAFAIASLTNNSSEAVALTKDKTLTKILEFVKKFGEAIEDNDDDINLLLISNIKTISKLDKKYHQFLFDLLIQIQNDKIKKMLCFDDIVFSDTLELCTLTLSKKQEIEILEIIIKYKERLKYYVNIDLMYSSMFVEIGRVR